MLLKEPTNCISIQTTCTTLYYNIHSKVRLHSNHNYYVVCLTTLPTLATSVRKWHIRIVHHVDVTHLNTFVRALICLWTALCSVVVLRNKSGSERHIYHITGGRNHGSLARLWQNADCGSYLILLRFSDRFTCCGFILSRH